MRLAAAAVHLYTALGSVVGLLVVVAAVRGEIMTALWLLLLALVIDGTDGTLARLARVKEIYPWFDGARLDDIVDYVTYTFAPVVLLWVADAFPEGAFGLVVASLPLLASSYQFCRVDAKPVDEGTADHFFLGFPSYWNLVAFYVLVLDIGTVGTTIIVIVCTVLVFVPVRYLYPSRMETLRTPTLLFSAVWAVSYAVLLLQAPDPHPAVVALSLGYVAYYAGLSVWFTVRGARDRSAQRVQSDRQV